MAGEIQKALCLQPLWGYIDDFIFPLPGVAQGQAELPLGEGAVEISGPHTGLEQCAHLVLHQGNQGGNHQGDALHAQGGDLKADGFTGAGGHDGQHVPALEQVLGHLPLAGAEGPVAEAAF